MLDPARPDDLGLSLRRPCQAGAVLRQCLVAQREPRTGSLVSGQIRVVGRRTAGAGGQNDRERHAAGKDAHAKLRTR
ncbi:hypothetical protein AKJ08_1564 [Vulgatibacter incomptus]|uniref:Uncharacterized protein n=1 Tax=Vulgatibacter incomptus TaxID=1391653 RepID=A0A0K1PCE0_9BACT|nr:hypothetical protein AKJ08_1564 [Vulgatibacter incomptus]